MGSEYYITYSRIDVNLCLPSIHVRISIPSSSLTVVAMVYRIRLEKSVIECKLILTEDNRWDIEIMVKRVY